MGSNVTEKILREHLVVGELKPGSEIGIRIDQTLTQGATGTMAYLQFEAMGIPKIRNELAVSYVDHNTTQVGPENAEDHRYLQTVAAKYGVVFSRPGNGICHQLHLERFAVPGKTLLGSDSHTPTGGGLGMIAIGAGGVDVAVAMAGGPYYLTAPRVVKVELTGRLKPWVTAKDVILKVLELFSARGNAELVLEYAGKGLASLDAFDRATITNMGAECGVITSVFPSDAETRRFMEAQGRGDAWREIVADPDAKYDRVVTIDLSELEPLAAAPHSPANICTVKSLAGTRVEQVLIGSCTNSSYRDLKMVAKLLEGKTVHPDVSLGIAPGSRQVLLMLDREKCVSTFLAAGARLLENACGFCIGNSMSPAGNSVSLRTSNRNFKGRTGTDNAKVYLVSPEIAALASVYGRVVDPQVVEDLKYPSVRMPAKFEVDDTMFIRPPADGRAVEVARGSNIGDPPKCEPLPESLAGEAAIKVGDDITTDDIMPAGARLKYRSNIPAYSAFVFERQDKSFAARATANRDKGVHNFIVAGKSYGQGSSREHAALCPMYLGVKAVVAVSIERIHAANLINYGIVPFLFDKADDAQKIAQGDRLSVAGVRKAMEGDGVAVLRNETKGADIKVRVKLSDRQKQIILAGGLINHAAATSSK